MPQTTTGSFRKVLLNCKSTCLATVTKIQSQIPATGCFIEFVDSVPAAIALANGRGGPGSIVYCVVKREQSNRVRDPAFG